MDVVRPLACKAASAEFSPYRKPVPEWNGLFLCEIMLLLRRGLLGGGRWCGGRAEVVLVGGACSNATGPCGLADGAGVAAEHGEVGLGIVEKLPLVVVDLLMPEEDGLFGTVGGESHDAEPAHGGVGAHGGACG